MRTADIARKTGEDRYPPVPCTGWAGGAATHSAASVFSSTCSRRCAAFGLLDLTLRCEGDLHVDAHHTVEDVGICLGQAIAQALGDKRGIARLGHACVPMDEALALAALDVSGRPYLVLDAQFDAPMVARWTRSWCGSSSARSRRTQG